MNPDELTAGLKRAAERLGFARIGICPAVEAPGFDRFQKWLTGGFHGEMSYLPAREAAYAHPRSVLNGVRSVVMLATNYRTVEPAEVGPDQGRVSRYAWGEDYHDLIRSQLGELAAELQKLAPTAKIRGVIDTAPLLEREFAQLAGLGWIGKNTLLLNRELGSWFFLAAILTDLDLTYDAPTAHDHCGTCNACLTACPTGAFAAPYVLDARKCISYLTIELRTPIPVELRAGVGDWLFGCDVCQDVCPWNRFAPITDEPALQPGLAMNPVDLSGLFFLDEAEFRRRFRETPLWRPRRRGLLRNAAIVLGNRPTPEAIPALIHGLCDPEELVREACAWALAQYDDDRARAALSAATP